MESDPISIGLPVWVEDIAEFGRAYASDADKMALAIRLARENVERGTGGPFGAAVFERATGRLTSVGVNSVVRLANPTAHAEMIALQLATARRGTFSLAGPPAHELFSSCDPCAMCLGAVLWSGVSRLACAASREDALSLGFDEGPVFADSWTYLIDKGIALSRGVLRDDARAVLDAYRGTGPIYNG